MSTRPGEAAAEAASPGGSITMADMTSVERGATDSAGLGRATAIADTLLGNIETVVLALPTGPVGAGVVVVVVVVVLTVVVATGFVATANFPFIPAFA